MSARSMLAPPPRRPDGGKTAATRGRIESGDPADISSNVRHNRRLFEDLVGPDPEGLQNMGSEGVDERDVRSVPASRDNNSAYPWDIVARIESPPRPVEEHLYPGAEIHRIDHGHANVAKMAIDVPSRNVEASAKRDGEMRESRQTPIRSSKASNAVRVARACI